ncbi:MAG: hypothetical protein ACYCS8_02290 [Acidithiobacillus sp.]
MLIIGAYRARVAGRDGKHIPGAPAAIRILHGQHRPAAGGDE